MTALRCPVCLNDLQAGEKQYVCAAGHSFDVARQGYVNLLLSSQRPSQAPGDSAEMVADRRAFLEAGHYRPLREHVEAWLDRRQQATGALRVLDLGCGEGYYTAAFAGREGRQVYALDISKPALASAAKRDRNVTWCVGTSRALPFHDRSLDVVLNIFCRPHVAETRRVLGDDGTLLLVGPGVDHLQELRAVLYDNVVRQESHSTEEVTRGGFVLRHTATLDYEFTVEGPAIGQLARMTPHYWRAPQAGRERLDALATLTLSARFVVQAFSVAGSPVAESPAAAGPVATDPT